MSLSMYMLESGGGLFRYCVDSREGTLRPVAITTARCDAMADIEAMARATRKGQTNRDYGVHMYTSPCRRRYLERGGRGRKTYKHAEEYTEARESKRRDAWCSLYRPMLNVNEWGQTDYSQTDRHVERHKE